MNADIQEIVFGIILAALPVVTGSGWYLRQRWLVRHVGNVIAMVVERVALNEVHPAKQATADKTGRYDLTESQAKQVMESAKQQVVEVAQLKDYNTPWHYPSVAAVVSDPKVLEAKIEAAVQERKQRRPPVGLKGGGARP